MTPPSLFRFGSALLTFYVSGCSLATVRIDELNGDDVTVALDASARVHLPGRRIKFFVDLHNRSDATVDLQDLEVRLEARSTTAPETVSLSEEWTYRWEEGLSIPGQKRLTVPILPERSRQLWEFPLEQLSPGSYRITAIVNERLRSKPYLLSVERPELRRRRLPSIDTLKDLPSDHPRIWTLKAPNTGD